MFRSSPLELWVLGVTDGLFGVGINPEFLDAEGVLAEVKALNHRRHDGHRSIGIPCLRSVARSRISIRGLLAVRFIWTRAI